MRTRQPGTPYRIEQEPVEKPGTHARHDDQSKAYSHPAFGQIQANRVNGSAVLYGSDFEHHGYIMLRIFGSELHRDLARDWHFPREQHIEVAMSEAQWATFVSSLNTGSGTPCTIQHLGGEIMPSIPLRRQDDTVRAEFAAKAKQVSARVQQTIATIEGELGAGISKTKKAALLEHLRLLERDLGDSMPFLAKSFAEHMETTVEKGKVEIHGYMQAAVQQVGLQALAASGAAPEGPIALLPGAPDGADTADT